ncbi:DUF1176 domain-containing protein [Shewanella sp. 125m-1]
MQRYIQIVGILSLLMSASASASAVDGLSFGHGDWQVVCDNTHTCRAVGYHNQDTGNAPVSVIFEREAGANTQIKAKVKFAESLTAIDATQVHDVTITLNINDVYQSQLGAEIPAYEVMGVGFSGERELTKEQTSQLLNALTMKGSVSITFTSSSGKEWHLSTSGSTAVLLKMDDFQGLVDTPYAIVKKGQRTSNIVEPKQAPVISIPAGDQRPLTTDNDRALAKTPEFIARMKRAVEACDIAPSANGYLKLDVARLTKTQLVVTTPCWFAAYNYGEGVWLVDDNPKIEPLLITDSAINYADGTINEFMLGRGVGDCVSARRYMWNGRDFILADSYSTGPCREIAPGGAWYLPTTVSTVIVGDDPAAGIDCQSKHAYSTERMVRCTQRMLASVELQLTELIEEISSLQYVMKDNDLKAALSQAQHSWLTYRNDVCKVTRLTQADGSMGLPLMVGCKLDLTEKRLKQLQLLKASLI